MGFEAVMIEDGQPVLRSKRRLILTTQLLQLLLCPPSFSVLSAEAILHHQSIIQCIARATLGDACSALSFTRGDAIVPSNGGNLYGLQFCHFISFKNSPDRIITWEIILVPQKFPLLFVFSEFLRSLKHQRELVISSSQKLWRTLSIELRSWKMMS